MYTVGQETLVQREIGIVRPAYRRATFLCIVLSARSDQLFFSTPLGVATLFRPAFEISLFICLAIYRQEVA